MICPTVAFYFPNWQVGRAGRFGTKGLAITFVSSASDSDVLNQVKFMFFDLTCITKLLSFILNVFWLISGSGEV